MVWSRRRLVVALLPLASLTLGIACEDLGGPNDVRSIQFDSSLQVYPSIVEGEQLRDSNGAVQTLRAVAFNGSGKAIDKPSITFLSFDTLVTVTTSGSVTAKGFRDTPAKIFASTGALQSNPLQLHFTRRPDTMFVSSFRDSLGVGGGQAQVDIGVRLQNRDSTNALQPVPYWFVSWQVEHAGTIVTDTNVAYLITPESKAQLVFRHSSIDTTATDGGSARTLVAKLSALAKPLDSIVVIASARYHGALVPTAPLRIVVHIPQ